MPATRLRTENLDLVLQTPEEVLAWVEAMPAADRAEVSPGWLAQVRASAGADLWLHGFALVQRATGAVVGRCGFKGPPTEDGVVEIAYGVDSNYQRKGYATEAAQALVAYAFDSGRVRTVRAHTLPDATASQRVLTKCGFRCIGEVMDPEDGLVWRWEKKNED